MILCNTASGIVIPDSGAIQVDGKVTGLLELGTGFNYEMTGLENIYMNGTLIGMRSTVRNRRLLTFRNLGSSLTSQRAAQDLLIRDDE